MSRSLSTHALMKGPLFTLAFLLAACSGENSTTKSEDKMTDTATMQTEQTDPYLWLEEVDGKAALAFVEEMNTKSLARLEGDSRFSALKDRVLSVYNATDKIAYGNLSNGQVNNFWQDGTNVRGLWRRTSVESYKSDTPTWETVLDLDKLSEAEGENWVYKGRDCLPGTSRCMIQLSRGGGDAVVLREFDTETKTFVEGGFYSPESKQSVAWHDMNTLLIATNFGDGTMNESGYPRQVRHWQRGSPLENASTVLDSAPEIVFNFPLASHKKNGTYKGVLQGPDFFTQIIHIMDGDTLKALDLPRGIDFKGIIADKLIIQMREDWTVGAQKAPAGSLITLSIPNALNGQLEEGLEVLMIPHAGTSIDGVSAGLNKVYVKTLSDVTAQLHTFTLDGGRFTRMQIGMPSGGDLSIVSVDNSNDVALVNFESHLQPDSLYVLEGEKPDLLRSLPARFDADGLVVEQKFTASKDGTRIPYFLVRHKDTVMDGSTPTILYGYGGFEISLTPGYLSGFPMLWTQEGGAYAIANIRGGGEYGPKWHQAALNENRQRAYDDFIAVAEDLIDTGVTTPGKLGIRGGSNGGLLMGAMFTQRPDLFEAVICAVPLLDMMRYHKLLAGASWVGEYGNPDIPEEREWIRTYSPYQKVNAQTKYPEIFFYTSTKDDRVHPGHARKMARKMTDMGHPVLYYENTEGGHAAAANLKQRAYTDALQTVYALQKLKDQ